MFVIPIGHNKTITHIPWVTAAVGLICLLVQLQHSLFAPSQYEYVVVDRQLQLLDRGVPLGKLRAGLEDAPSPTAAEVDDSPSARAALHDRLLARRTELRRKDLSLFLGQYYDEGLFSLRLLTCAFAHGGWLHLIGNMLFLYLCGCTLEDRWGRGPYLGFYAAGAIIASAFPVMLHRGEHVISLGASGAIAACMGAFIVFWGATEITFFYVWLNLVRPKMGTFRASAYWAIGAWFLLQFLDFVLEAKGAGGGVSYSAHVSGFVFGAGVALVVKQLGFDAKLVAAVDAEDGNWQEDDVVAKALALMHDGDEQGALMKLKELRRAQPRNATVLHELHELGLKQGDHEALQATSSEVLLELARNGEGRTVIDRLRKLTALVPALPLTDRALAHCAQCAFELEENALGVELSSRLMKSFPQSPLVPRSLVEVAKAQERAGRPDQARRTLEHVIAKYPLDPFAREAQRMLGAAAGPAAPKSA